MDLPPIYKWLFEDEANGRSYEGIGQEVIPEHVRNECISRWHVLPNDFNLSPPNWSENWSKDWSQFDKLHHWLAPVLFWNDNDCVYDKFIVISRLRDEHCVYGEPIPLMYDTHNPPAR